MRFHNLEKEVLSLIKKEKVVSSSEVAKKFKISWNTAEKYLMELLIKNKLIRKKLEGVNLWLLK